MDGITPPHLHHFPGTDCESVFWVTNSSGDSMPNNCDAKKMYVELTGFEKWGKSKAHV
jgi:hypothetical protein